jgi:hypothetical protein
MLKVFWDSGRDYIENFVPFVVEAVRAADHDEISLPEIQDGIYQEFGLRIPQGALKTILKRVAHRNLLTRGQGIYRRTEALRQSKPLMVGRENCLRQQSALVSKLVDFCRERHKVSWTTEQAEGALLSYLTERSTPILAAAVEGTRIVDKKTDVENADFLVSSFVLFTNASDPEGFGFLETITKGNLLANVLLYPNLGDVGRKFDKTSIFLDSRIIIQAMGLTRPALHAATRELLELAYGQNARFACFGHTLDEIRRILEACLHVLRNPSRVRRGYGGALDYFIETGATPSDVQLVTNRLAHSLASLRIRIEEKPKHEKSLGVDERRLQTILQTDVGYHSEDALLHDLESLTAIHRLRRGDVPQSLENCGAIFVTSNGSLARASARFSFEEYGGARGAVPLCMLDHTIETLVWLKTPIQAPDLPRNRIIADCYAALNPSDLLWRAYLNEIDRLRQSGQISEEDYYLLRFSGDARRALMDLTFGDHDAFSEGTVEEVLERAKANARAEIEERLQAETEKRQAAERQIAVKEEKEKAQTALVRGRLEYMGTIVGKWVTRGILTVAFVLMGLGIYLTLPKPFPEMNNGWIKFIAPALILLVAILTVFHLIFGTTVQSLVHRLEIRISRRMEGLLTRFLGLEERK